MCNAVGASGVGCLDFSLAEMKAIMDGKERVAWRHTLLNYSCSYNPNNKAMRALYPYHEEGRTETSREAHEAGVKQLENLVKSKF